MSTWLPLPYRWIYGRGKMGEEGQTRTRRLNQHLALTCEALEDRVVLDGGGGVGSLIGALNSVGVETSAFVARPLPSPLSSVPAIAAYQTAKHTLESDLQTLAQNSHVTVADLTKLGVDSQAIGGGDHSLNRANLQKAVSDLATAVATSSSTTTALGEFAALYPSSVSTTAITNVENDLIKIITDSTVSATGLTTISSDTTALQTARAGLPSSHHGDFGGEGDGGDGGGIFASGLAAAGVAISPSVAPATPPTLSSNAAVAKLQTDRYTLQTELQSLAAKSNVTAADLTQLAIDSQTLAASGLHVSRSAYKPVAAEIAAGASTAQADFNKLFAGSTALTSAQQTAITAVFTDLTKIVTDSGITASDLSTLAADQAAVQADLQALPGAGGHGGHD